MHRRQLLYSLILVALLTILVSGIALAKAHVPAGQVQVSHKGAALNVAASALSRHIGHGDFQLPACDFNNVFGKGADTSALSDTNGNGIFDKGDTGFNNPRKDAGGITAACPPETF